MTHFFFFNKKKYSDANICDHLLMNNSQNLIRTHKKEKNKSCTWSKRVLNACMQCLNELKISKDTHNAQSEKNKYLYKEDKNCK